MTRRLRGWRTGLLVAWLAACSACCGQRVRLEPGPGEPLAGAGALKFPGSFRMVQRVRLSVRGRGMDFIGYLAVSGDCLRALAMMEVGGVMFDLLGCAGKMTVLKNPGRVPPTPLKRGILRELACIFAPAPPASAVPGADGRGNERLTSTLKTSAPEAGGEISGAKPVELLLFENGRLYSRIEIASFRTIAGWPHPIPDRFTLKNLHWGYEMQVELLRMDMRPIENRVFSER
jgi:hypothetical protein